MQTKTIIIGSSIAVLTAGIIYSNLKTDVKEPTKIQEVKAVQTPKEIKIIPKQETLVHTIVEPKIKPKIEVKKKVFKTQYTLSILPQNMSVQEKKQRFNELLLPAINKVYSALTIQYNKTKLIIEKQGDNKTINALIASYNASSEEDLLKRLKPHPKSIAIAQAAMQSGWATSRFTLIANNLFGVWSFDVNEPRVQAHETREGKVIYVKRYASLQESIKDYYFLLATSVGVCLKSKWII